VQGLGEGDQTLAAFISPRMRYLCLPPVVLWISTTADTERRVSAHAADTLHQPNRKGASSMTVKAEPIEHAEMSTRDEIGRNSIAAIMRRRSINGVTDSAKVRTSMQVIPAFCIYKRSLTNIFCLVCRGLCRFGDVAFMMCAGRWMAM